MQGEHGATPLHYASRYRRNIPKGLVGVSYDLPNSSDLYRSRRRRRTLKNLVGVRKKGSGLLGAGRGAKRKNDDQGKAKTKLKGMGPGKRQLMQRLFRPLWSKRDADAKSSDIVVTSSPCSTPNFADTEIELSERKSLIDIEGSGHGSVESSSNAEISKVVPHIIKERATPDKDEKKSDYDEYDDYFVDTRPPKIACDSISLGKSDLGDSQSRLRGKSVLNPTDRFLDISLNSRPPVKSLSMPDIQAVDDKNEGCNEEKTGIDASIIKNIPDNDKVTLGRSETFSSPRMRHIHKKIVGDGVIENLMTEGRSLDTLWTRVGKSKKVQDESIILYLLEHNANINARDYYGATPLHYAAQRGNFVAVKELLSDTNIDIEVIFISKVHLNPSPI